MGGRKRRGEGRECKVELPKAGVRREERKRLKGIAWGTYLSDKKWPLYPSYFVILAGEGFRGD